MFFNYSTHIVDNGWTRRTFVRNWWKIYGDDPRWAPPPHDLFVRTLQPAQFQFMDRAVPVALYLDAFRRSQERMTVAGGNSLGFSGSIFEMPVAATILLIDPRHVDRTAYLAGFRFVNDSDVLDRFLAVIMEELWRQGCRRIVGPVDFSPNLAAGVLRDHFHVTPPSGTPYNPPYVAELMDMAMRPLGRSHLYRQALPEADPPPVDGPAALSPIQPQRLADDLFPIFQSGFAGIHGLPSPDEAETKFLLAWATAWPLQAWLATVNGKPAGFIVLQPDLSGYSRRANGGRNPLWRGWLKWAQRRPSKTGRILYGGVADDWRGRGIGRQLWQQASVAAQQNGWRQLYAGPIAENSDAAAFLIHMGAEPQQHYTTYYLDI